MKCYYDTIYGKKEITQPVLQEFLECPTLQRLEKISQHMKSEVGLTKRYVTRFEHSVGVMILLKIFGADLKEQIAGLLHDISHTVFSHVGDFVYGESEKQERQDRIFYDFLMNSEIPDILYKHGINAEEIANYANFPLLENNLPDLCADRLDYFLRDVCWTMGIVSKKEVNNFLDNLAIIGGKFVFKNFEVAKRFADLFYKMNDILWAAERSEFIYTLLGEVIKNAIEKGFLDESDLFTTDQEVWDILNRIDDPYIKEGLKKLMNKDSFKIDKENYNLRTVSKLRLVDPLVLVEDETRRVSELSPDFKEKLDEWQNSKVREWHIKC